ncbi:HAD family hydrolase [Chromobacterium subtsugae]|uniref:HAD family hydrolase n=1 Tax=Chromobacterium subtsugae TaxID=251747 RepID=UPI00069C529F|nr:HAD family phosphatase [Chromobacterium subtsugae]
MSKKPSVLVFDLGGVLVDWNGIDPLIRLSGGRLSREEARLFWMHFHWTEKLDLGACTPLEFSAAMADELRLDLSAEAMQAQLRSWNRGAFPGARALLEKLSADWQLAALSNINSLHWQQVSEEFQLLDLFGHTFASFQLRLRKPQPEIYRHVQQTLGLAPADIAFFDDNIECVAAARAEGWQAFHTIGFDSLQRTLREQGWL